MQAAPEFDPEILEYYVTEGEELARINHRLHERIRVRELLERYLPAAPSVVLDVGGGPGNHAFWLAAKGYEVHMIDPVPLHIEQAEELAQTEAARPSSISIGDIRSLGYDDGSVDAVYASGPIYHLPERSDRLRALREVRRVLRLGGRAIVTAIPRTATLMDGLYHDVLPDDDFRRGVYETLETGVHRNPGKRGGLFTTAYFHWPDDLRAEAEEAELVVETLIGIEGPERLARHPCADGFDQNEDMWWSDPARRTMLLEAIRAVESVPNLLCLSSHLMLVASK